MQKIQIQIDCYGAVEKLLPHNLVINIKKDILIKAFIEELKTLYPKANEMLEHCACAVEDRIVSRQEYLSEDCTLVLLSPVAGG